MHTIGDFAQHDEDLQQIQEERDDAGIDQIGEHGSDDGDDEERLDGIAVFVAYSTHVGHRIGGSTKAETTHSSTKDGSVVVATQQRECHNVD